jgi:hypothetical protein
VPGSIESFSTVFAAVQDDGVKGYSYDGSNLVHLDTLDNGSIYTDVMTNTTGEGIFVLRQQEGLSYTNWNGTNFNGTVYHSDLYNLHNNLYVHDGICHVAQHADGLAAYRYRDDLGVPFIERIATVDDGGYYYDVYVNDTYVFVAVSYDAAGNDDIFIYEFDGTSYTLVDSCEDGLINEAWDVYTDDEFIYCADYSNTVSIRSFIYVPDPSPPTGVAITYTGGNNIQINWTNAVSNATIVVRNEGSIPSSPTDGTEVYNGTGTTYDFTTSSTEYYYRLYSYNELKGGHAYSTSADLPDGGLLLNCFDANTTSNLTFDIFVSNQDGSSVYNASGCTNTFSINLSVLPYGENTQVIFSADGYEDEIFYIDIEEFGWYQINGFLSLSNVSNLYFFQVVDEYNSPLADARIRILKYINETYGFANLTILLSDGYGYANTYLEAGVLHKVITTLDSYTTSTIEYIPDEDYFGYYYPKIIKITFIHEEPETYVFSEWITFTATKYNNNSIYVNYVDALTNTTDITFYTYELGNFSKSLNATNSSTSNTFWFWVEEININRSHEVLMHLNHTNFGHTVSSIKLDPLITPILDPEDIENKFEAVFGQFDLGFVMFFFIYLPCVVLLVLPGKVHPGLGIILSSLYLGFTQIALEFTVPLELYSLVPAIFAIAILLMALKKGWVNI